MGVPVFISYHGSDIELAKDLQTSLKRLSNQFQFFLDRYSIEPGEKYETVIAEEIKKAEWFLIVCTGFPRRDADMMWSFFEAGQFRATLRDTLKAEANKRIVCIFDDEPPAVLSMFQGVKVCALQRSGEKIVQAQRAATNIQYDDTAIYSLLERMLLNKPEPPLRDVAEPSTKEMLREESAKLIKLFAEAGPNTLLYEKSLQPRISFDLVSGQTLQSATKVKGYDQSLRNLFGIEPDETTWGKITSVCQQVNVGNPRWLTDIEAAAAKIIADETPENVGNKCILAGTVYRVIVARYEVFKDGRRAIYVAFLAASTRPFDLSKSYSTLLSALILSVRFREQIIPMAEKIRSSSQEELSSVLQNFYRDLVGVEIEARQFGLVLDTDVANDEAPLAAVMSVPKRRKIIQKSIDDWSADRAQIEEMFATKPLNLSLPDQAQQCADKIFGALERIEKPNKKFIETITVELLTKIRARERLKRTKRSTKNAKRTETLKPTGASRKATSKRRSRDARKSSR
jgi:TIR domain